MDLQPEPRTDRPLPQNGGTIAINPGELRALLSSLSHELCRPLVSLRAGFDLLLRDPASSVATDQRGHLETMLALCDDMLRLTRGYLDYAGLVNGSRTPALGAFSLGAIVGEIDRQFRSLAEGQGLIWEAVAHDPHVKVQTDASLCLQIVGNLVSNAIKYTPRGGHVRLEASASDGAWSVAVSDDGPGIPPESVERVFEPFYRLARDEHSRIEGNGLGLSICRELSERLGGTIALDSTCGLGTIVQVRFPRPACDGAAPTPCAEPPTGGLEPPATTGSRGRSRGTPRRGPKSGS